VDQCKRNAEGRTFQRLPPFERGEIKVPATVESAMRSQIAAGCGGTVDAAAWEIVGAFGEAAGDAF
jgi:hypothetical protein